MKALKYSAIVLAGLFLFAGCQKEFSIDNEFTKSSAAGSLKDDMGNCMSVIINGNYLVDSTLTDSNHIVVQVNFSAPGTYNISTDTSNGFSFAGAGITQDSGLQNITLKGSGKPVLAQQTDFSLTFDTSVCTFSIAVTTDSISETAVYALAGSPDNCSNAEVEGTYEEETPLDSANRVSIQVDVTAAGSYSISAGPTNGMTFSAQGNFTETGVQTVILQGSGTPVTTGTNTVPVKAGGTACSFSVAVSSFNPPGADSGWQFNVGTNFYHGFIDTAFTHKDSSIGTGTALSFYGSTYPDRDTLFQVDLLLPDSTAQTGIYNSDSGKADFYLYNPDMTKTPYYRAYQLITPEANIQVIISSYNPLTKIIKGSFSGTAVNDSGQKVNVTGGKIYAKVD